MPRYFFDVHNGGPQFDDTGTELSNPDEAREEAKSLLPNIAREEIPKDGDQRTFTVLVKDEHGCSVYSATLTYSGMWLKRQVDHAHTS